MAGLYPAADCPLDDQAAFAALHDGYSRKILWYQQTCNTVVFYSCF
jgi:hypothetical protein